jgi:hypothetical protein
MTESSNETFVSARALQLLQDIARAMGEQFVDANRKPLFAFRAVFRADTPNFAVDHAPSYDGAYFIEGEGKGLDSYYPNGSDEKRFAQSGFVPVVSLRLVGCLNWTLYDNSDAPPLTLEEESFSKTATALYYAPRLVPGTFREDVRRFMRDYFGHDIIRFCDYVPARGVKARAWQSSCM